MSELSTRLFFFGRLFQNTLRQVADFLTPCGAFFVSVAPCGHTAVVLCSAYNVSPENIIKALFISTFASIGTIFFAIQYLQVA